MKIIEKFRENHPEGYEVDCWYSSYDNPHWELAVWVTLDRWGLGLEVEVDPGSPCWERRVFTSLDLGPLHITLTRVSDYRG